MPGRVNSQEKKTKGWNWERPVVGTVREASAQPSNTALKSTEVPLVWHQVKLFPKMWYQTISTVAPNFCDFPSQGNPSCPISLGSFRKITQMPLFQQAFRMNSVVISFPWFSKEEKTHALHRERGWDVLSTGCSQEISKASMFRSSLPLYLSCWGRLSRSI